MFIFLLRIRPHPHQHQEALDILRHVEGPTSAKAGCLSCGTYAGVGEDPAVLYLEQWESASAIQQHIQSALFSKIMIVMDMAAEQPEVSFFEITRVQGLDLVEALRGPGADRQQTC